jgi:hypothetical protein
MSQVVTGEYFTCALTSEGLRQCWGSEQGYPPNTKFAVLGTFTELSANNFHACGLRPGGLMECWGDLAKANTPPQRSAASGSFVHIAAGRTHSCALRTDNSAECWGDNTYGQAPATRSATTGSFTAISAGQFTTCGLRTDGVVECWGEFAVTKTAAAGRFVSISIKGRHACALRSDGVVECWGMNMAGQAPASRVAATGSFTNVSAGDKFTCAVRSDGIVECWGANVYGRAPATRTAASGSFVQVDAGFWHTCGLRTDSAVECWGRNDFGQSANTEQVLTFTISPPNPASVGFAYEAQASSNVAQPTQVISGTSNICERDASSTFLMKQPGTCVLFALSNGDQTYRDALTPYVFEVTLLVPAAPSGLTATWAGLGTVDLAWNDNSSDEERFVLQVALLQPDKTWGPWETVSSSIWANTTAYQDDSVTVNRTYRYRIRACADRCSTPAVSNQVFIAEPTAPVAPSTPAFVIHSGTWLEVQWTDMSNTEDRFEVQRRQVTEAGNLAWVPVATQDGNGSTVGNVEIFNDMNLTSGATYQYRVRACNAIGCSSWATSAHVTTPTIPNAPTALTGVQVSNPTRIRWTWVDQSTDETEFRIGRRTRNTDGTWGEWTPLYTNAANDIKYADPSVVVGNTYMYRVRACNLAGCSAWLVSRAFTVAP